MKKHKILYIFLFSFIGLFVLFIASIAISNQLYKSKLLNEGIRVEVQVVWMEQAISKKGVAKHSYVGLAIYPVIKHSKKNTVKSNQNFIEAKIDAIFENASLNTSYREYQSVRKDISKENYGHLNIGDWVTFVYIEGELKDGKLLMSLE